jgi:hypothetical protein
MLRKLVSAVVILALCIGVAVADEITGVITKVDGNKITFTEFKGKGEKGAEKTLPADDKVKVVKGKFSKDGDKFKIEPGEPLEGGLKNEVFTKIGEKGVFSTIVTDKDNKQITEIRVFIFGGKKKEKDK